MTAWRSGREGTITRPDDYRKAWQDALAASVESVPDHEFAKLWSHSASDLAEIQRSLEELTE